MFSPRQQRLLPFPFLRLFLAALLPLAGCQPASDAPPASSNGGSAPAEIPWLEAETWDVSYLQDVKVGYSHTTQRTLTEAGRTLIQTRAVSELTLSRAGESVTQQFDLTSVETPSGELVRFETRLVSGQQPITSSGQVEGNRLVVVTHSQGKSQTARIPWQNDYGGFFADRLSRLRDPLQPKEERTISTLVPIFNQVATVKMIAGERETVMLPAGEKELLRVDSTLTLGAGQQIKSTLWVDERGRTFKELEQGLGQLSYRATEAIAKAPAGGSPLDLLNFSIAKVARRLENPHQTTQVVYRVELKEDDPSKVFAASLSQQVKRIDDHTAEITVQAVRPHQPAELPAPQRQPSDEDLAANNLIQSDDPRVVKLAQQAAADEKDPWQVALALESLVRRSIRKKDFSQAFATAAEVAENLEGDCTEHAVLLAALCRARGIPARVAIGLVYYAPQGGFAYHMWDEVWINDRWVPLDATLGRGGIGGAHLKLIDSNLEGSNAYGTFLPVYQVLGRLNLEIVSSK